MTHLSGDDSARYVQGMFAQIASRYNLMNRVMTVGQDSGWRRRVVKLAQLPPDGVMLDIATGTGDIAYEALRQHPDLKVFGGDFTLEMMRVGKNDPARKSVRWVGADTLALPFPDATFHAVTSGFLMRNVIDVPAAFIEQLRVTKPGGRVVVLESSPPKDNFLRPFIIFHLNTIIPMLGRVISGHPEAYRYLPDSTQQFQEPESLVRIMRDAGLVNVGFEMFMFGTIAIHFGQKPA